MSNILKARETNLIDLEQAANSADAMQELDYQLANLHQRLLSPGDAIAINFGATVLSQALLVKVQTLTANYGYVLDTIYSTAPQTQQSALNIGLTVKNTPASPSKNAIEKEQAKSLDELSSKWNEQINEFFSRVDTIKQEIPESIQKQPTPPQPIEIPLQEQQAISNQEPTLQNGALPFSPEDPKQESVNGNAATMPPEELMSLIEQTIPQTESPLHIKFPDGSTQELALPKEEIKETLLYRQSLRSGQVLKSEGNVVVIGDVHAGAEIIAGGDIYVWGVLSGCAHAGIPNRPYASIKAFRIEALQLRIAGYAARRPDRLFKEDFHRVERSENAQFKTEVARVINQEIQIFEDTIRL